MRVHLFHSGDSHTQVQLYRKHEAKFLGNCTVTVLYRVSTTGAIIRVYRFDCTIVQLNNVIVDITVEQIFKIKSRYKITKVKEIKILPDRPRGEFCPSSGAGAEKIERTGIKEQFDKK